MSIADNNDYNSLLTVFWEEDNTSGSVSVKLIDQTKLPESLEYVVCTTYYEVADAIKKLSIRGAPAIGVAAAMALALFIANYKSENREELLSKLKFAYDILLQTRPTAVNLKWGLDKVMEEVKKYHNVQDIKE
ncbi:MAG: S-methyl-5-thioribose-1-phosphate isomerase, partial [Candidatus Nitrosocosmicus sp.]